MPSKWELWYAGVAFEDDPDTVKDRPVVVIDQDHCYFISLKVTTHEPRAYSEGEFLLQRWKEAGLDHESTIRCSKRLKLVAGDFRRKIGRLHPTDIILLQQRLELMR